MWGPRKILIFARLIMRGPLKIFDIPYFNMQSIVFREFPSEYNGFPAAFPHCEDASDFLDRVAGIFDPKLRELQAGGTRKSSLAFSKLSAAALIDLKELRTQFRIKKLYCS